MRSIFVQANGLRFHVLEEVHDGGGGELALCLHGFPELGYSYRDQLPALARLGYRAWAPDLRGYGQTERPSGIAAYAIETLIDDVVGLIDAAGVERATLIAHDWGGLIAWHVAMRCPERLARLVILNIPHPAVLVRRLWPRQLFALTYVLLFQVPGLAERALSADGHRRIDQAFLSMAVNPARFPEEVLRAYREAAAQPGALRAMLSYYRAYVSGGGALRELRRGTPVVETPTLMIWGEQDTALLKESTIGTERFVADLTVRYLPEASHWVQQEAPEAVNAILTAWLTGAPVPQAWELETTVAPLRGSARR